MLYRDLQTKPLIQIGENQPVVFVHVPKTAGTTFNHILDYQFNKEERCPWHYMNSPFEDFSNYQLFDGHFYLSVIQQLLSRPAIYLSFFRNPIERTISHYYHAKRHLETIRQQKTAVIENLPDTLEGFIEGYRDSLYLRITDLQTKTLGAKVQFSDHQTLQDALQLEYPVKAEDVYHVVDSLDFIGLTEEFDKSMAVLSHTFGWEPMFSTSAQNVGQYPKPSQAILDKIADLNQEDIKLYDYATSVFNNRFNRTLKDLSQRYYLISKASATPRTRNIHYNFNYLLGTGWHNPEITSDKHYFMWTSQPRSTLSLPVASGEENLSLSFCVSTSITPHILNNLRVSVNGHPISISKVTTSNNNLEYEGIIPKQAIPQDLYFSEIMFETEQLVRPMDIDPTNPDNRFLGLAFTWLKINPFIPPQQSMAEGLLPLEGLVATITATLTNNVLSTGAKTILPIQIKNISPIIWPSLGDENNAYAVKLGLYWIDNSGKIVLNQTSHIDLPHDIHPNTCAEFDIALTPPDVPGNYMVYLNLAQIITPWFTRWFNSHPSSFPVEVQG